MTTKWILRNARKSDLDFIYATWLNSFHYDSWTKSIRKSIFFDHYSKVITNLIKDATIIVACLKDEENVICGYIVSEKPNLIHYLYVKEVFRKLGIANDLYEYSFHKDQDIIITHKTRSVHDILRSKENIKFNPFLLFKGVQEDGKE